MIRLSSFAFACVVFMALGCLLPPGGAKLEREYNAERRLCRDLPKPGDCVCRLKVDEKYGMCDRPEWPRLGRCDYRCE